MNEISKDLVSKLFKYVDGDLIRKITVKHNAKKGDVAGCDDHKGYLITGINNKRYFNHRIIYLMNYGYLPEVVDHIDGNTMNNKIENLRACTKAENCMNNKNHNLSETKLKGVTFLPNGKYRVQISVNNKSKHLGCFNDLELAELVAIEARNKYHSNFANHKGV